MSPPGARATARAGWILILAAAAVLMVTNGARQSLGLYIAPIHTATGIAFADISLALAVGQFVWGLAQPLFGAFADRYGPVTVVIVGAFLICASFAATPFVHDTPGLIWTLGVLSAAGAGAGSLSILMAAVSRRLEPARRGMAAGCINAGASLGQFLFAPLTQVLIGAWGWVGAMWTMAALMLGTIPLALPLRGGAAAAPQAGGPLSGLGAQLREAARDGSYWMLNAGFLTCGFHVAFLVTHLPSEVNRCGLGSGVAATSLAVIGLTNIAGSLGAGWLGNRYRLKWLLFWMYCTRAAAIAVYLAAPRTSATFYAFAFVLGLTWLSTVPPTVGLVAKLFGTRFLATLFGMTLVSHQAGAFLGAWLGGIALSRFGNYSWMWYADIVLALGAALISLPIREELLAHTAPRSLAARAGVSGGADS